MTDRRYSAVAVTIFDADCVRVPARCGDRAGVSVKYVKYWLPGAIVARALRAYTATAKSLIRRGTELVSWSRL